MRSEDEQGKEDLMHRRGKCIFVIGFSLSRLVGSSPVIWSDQKKNLLLMVETGGTHLPLPFPLSPSLAVFISVDL